MLFDNGMFGNVRLIQDEHYGGRAIASDLKNPDFVRLAESFGMVTHRATSPAEVERHIKSAFSANVPTLIHVPVGRMPSPWDMILMPPVRG